MAEIETTEIHFSDIFECTPQEFYRAITTESTVVAFMVGNCKVDAREGGIFDLFGVQGYFVKLVPNQLIAQRWRLKTWQRSHFSDVTIHIKQRNDCTEVHVWQCGIPLSEIENTLEAWKWIYWKNIKATFAYNANLMYLIRYLHRL